MSTALKYTYSVDDRNRVDNLVSESRAYCLVTTVFCGDHNNLWYTSRTSSSVTCNSHSLVAQPAELVGYLKAKCTCTTSAGSSAVAAELPYSRTSPYSPMHHVATCVSGWRSAVSCSTARHSWPATYPCSSGVSDTSWMVLETTSSRTWLPAWKTETSSSLTLNFTLVS